VTVPYDLKLRLKYKEVIKRLNQLPPFPAAAQQVLSIVSGDSDDIVQLETAIRHDPALAAQVLKVANSAAFVTRFAVDTVHKAIVYLGFTEIKNIAVGLSVFGLFRPENAELETDRRALLTHSIAVATIARLLALELGDENKETIYTSGLLHDIGRVALMVCFSRQWAELAALARQEKCSLFAMEKRFELSHCVIGAWLANSWRLPPVFVQGIATHHFPVRHPKANRIGSIVQLADILAHEAGMGFLEPPLVNVSALAHYLGAPLESIIKLQEQLAQLQGVADEVADLLNRV
jgi:putative nucleotidyltransferase with HDIG domain